MVFRAAVVSDIRKAIELLRGDGHAAGKQHEHSGHADKYQDRAGSFHVSPLRLSKWQVRNNLF
jgi:Cdc6-like AAA superfamily ATPase